MIDVNKINVTAHAGCMNTAMDSIESIESGIKNGADIIEVDVNIDKDKNIVLSHDLLQDSREYIPFYMVLEIMEKNRNILLNIDVKNTAVLPRLKNMISRYKLSDSIFLTGLTFNDIAENEEDLKGIHYLVNLEDSDIKSMHAKKLINKLKEMNAEGININHEFVTSELAAVFKEEKIILSVWTIDNVEYMDRAISLGVNSITTRNIDLLMDRIAESRKV